MGLLNLLYLVGFIILIWTLLFYSAPLVFWLMTGLGIILVGYLKFNFSLSFVIALSILFIISYIIFGIRPVRAKLITSRLIAVLRKKLPTISNTEAQAIEAGDVWWDGDIFSTKLNWKKFAAHELTKLSSEEILFINNQVDTLCSYLNDWDIVVKDKDLSKQSWDYIRNNQFFAINIPKQYGGLGFSATAQSCIVTKIATRSVTAAVTIMVPNSLGPGELLMHYGTDEQKNYYLPRLAKGVDIPCFALTSVYAGSDAGGMNDHGVICKQDYNGVETLGIRLNFSKRYITLAPVATVMGLAFKLYDPDELYSSQVDLGVTLALIPTNHHGVKIGRRHLAMMAPFQNGPISGEDVFIPMSFIIGGADYIGKGWFMLMECLSSGRGISLPALSAAVTQLSYLSSGTYSRLRTQFKTPISNLEGIQEHLAKIAGFNYITNAMRIVTTSAIDHQLKPAVISGIAKYHMTEFSRMAINSAMDICAGKAIMNGPDNYLVSAYMAAPIAITVEGANILTRNLIIFGQGAFRAHPYVLDEIAALTLLNPKESLHKFDLVLFKHIKFVISNITRIKTYALRRVFQNIYRKFIYKNNFIAEYQHDLTRLSTILALSTDFALLVVGGNLKVKERLSARLGDVLSYIYMALCIIKLHQELLKPSKNQSEQQTDYIDNVNCHTRWSLDYCIYMAQNALLDYMQNFPVKTLGVYLKLIAFPWGRSYKKPSDKADAKLAMIATKPSSLLDKLTDLVYLSNGNDSAVGLLKEVFIQQNHLSDNLDGLLDLAKNRKIKYSNDLKIMINEAHIKQLITAGEYQILLDFAMKLDQVINVNDFDSQLFNAK